MRMEDVVLRDEAHSQRKGFTIMELVACVNGEPWTDEPTCSPTMVTQFLRSWNNRCTHVTRQRLKEVVPYFVGCDTHSRWDDQRLYAFMDLALRRHCGAWLRVLGHNISIPEVVDEASSEAARYAITEVMWRIPLPENMDKHYGKIGCDVHRDSGGDSLFTVTGYKVCWTIGYYSNLLRQLIRLATFKGCELVSTREGLVTTNIDYVKRMLQLGR